MGRCERCAVAGIGCGCRGRVAKRRALVAHGPRTQGIALREAVVPTGASIKGNGPSPPDRRLCCHPFIDMSDVLAKHTMRIPLATWYRFRNWPPNMRERRWCSDTQSPCANGAARPWPCAVKARRLDHSACTAKRRCSSSNSINSSANATAMKALPFIREEGCRPRELGRRDTVDEVRG